MVKGSDTRHSSPYRGVDEKQIYLLCFLIFLAKEASSQFIPPFVPLNGLFATNTLRQEMTTFKFKNTNSISSTVKGDDSLFTSSESYWESDGDKDIDLEHAHECVDNYGKCEPKEIKTMRNALHTERLGNIVSGNVGIRSSLSPTEQLDHMLLEEDLELQYAALTNEMSTIPPPLFQPPVSSSSKKDTISSKELQKIKIPSVPMEQRAETDRIDATQKMPSFETSLRKWNDMFFLGNGVIEAMAMAMVFLILAVAPHILHI